MSVIRQIPPFLLNGNLLLRTKFIASILSTLQKSTNNFDVIDSFTTNLVERHTLKWEMLHENIKKEPSVSPFKNEPISKNIARAAKCIAKDIESLKNPDLDINIQNLSDSQLDNFLKAIMEEKENKDFIYIIKQCIEYEKLPNDNILIDSLEYLSIIAETELLGNLSEICKIHNNNLFKRYAELTPFRGIALWKSANVDLALATLLKGYDSSYNEDGLRRLHSAFKEITKDTIGKKSEAVLIKLLKVSEQIRNDFNDIFVIACVWRSTFGSEWFSDQKISGELFKKYEDLRSLVFKRSTTLTYSFLRQHDIDAVHRLIELFLKYKSKEACENALKLLFDYQYWRRDLRSCSEIMQYCIKLNLPLSEFQTHKLLTLLLDRPQWNNNSREIVPTENFRFKF